MYHAQREKKGRTKRGKTEGIEFSNQETIRNLGKKRNKKFSGILTDKR